MFECREVFVGMDVSKGNHAVAVADGGRALERRLRGVPIARDGLGCSFAAPLSSFLLPFIAVFAVIASLTAPAFEISFHARCAIGAPTNARSRRYECCGSCRSTHQAPIPKWWLNGK